MTQRAIMRHSVITLGPIFTKMVLNRAQGSKEKSQEVSMQKNVDQWRYNKNVEGGGFCRPPPLALLGLNNYKDMEPPLDTGVTQYLLLKGLH